MARVRFTILTVLVAVLLLPRPGATQSAPDPFADVTTGSLRVVSLQATEVLELPLQHTEVAAEVAGSVAQVRVTQEFVNSYKYPIEAVYVFPIPEDAAVDQMEMQIGERIIVAEIKKRDEARQIYEAAKQQGKRTALLEQERPNIFTQSVANILPGDNIKVSLRYFQLLPYKDNKFSFVFPTVVGPRYIPGGGVPDAQRITPPAVPPGFRSGHDIRIQVVLNAGGMPISNLQSVNHQVVEAPTGNPRIVSTVPQDAIPNKDFILEYSLAGQQPSFTVLSHKPDAGDGYFTLLALPPLAVQESEVTPKELFFVVDSSGSMSGEPIEKARQAMRFALEHLNPADTFYLIKFSNTVERFDRQPRENTPENIAAAVQYVNGMNASGGTEMLSGVREAIDTPLAEGRLRIVVFITDALIGNEAQVISAIQAGASKRVRMFPLGVGSTVNRYLIEEMARAGRGVAAYLPLRKDAGEVVEEFYARIASPLLTDVTLQWGGLDVYELVPGVMPDLFAGQPLVISGRYRQAGAAPVTIQATQTAQGVGGSVVAAPYTLSMPVVLPATELARSGLASIWARAKIGELSALMYTGETPELVGQVTQLGLQYHLVTQYTSFVAVEQKVVNVGGQLQRVDVPVPIPEGTTYEGFFGEVAAGRGGSLSGLANQSTGYGGYGGGGGLGATYNSGLSYATIVGWGTQDTRAKVFLVINIIFGFLGLIALVMLPIGIIRRVRHRKDQPPNRKGWGMIFFSVITVVIIFGLYAWASFATTGHY